MRMNKRFSRMFTRPLILERLDDRINPATIVVNSLLDSGTGSLREAISIANNESSNSGPDTIVFDSSIAGQTFDITSMGGTDYGPSAFQITSDITIQGSLSQAETLRIQSTFPMRFFYIESGGTLTLNRMQLTGGQAQGGAGGLGGGGGGAGMGGAIYNHQGNLNIINSTLYGNTAQGGNGGDGSLIASTGSTGGGGGMSGNGGAGGIGNAVGYGGGGGGFFGNGGSGQGSGSTGGGGGGTQSNGQSSGDGGAGGNLNGGNGINDISSSVPSDANGGDGGGGGGGTGRTSGGHGGIGGGGGGSGFNFEVSGQLGGSGGFGGGGGAGYAFGGRGGFGGGGGGTGNGGSEGGGFSGPFGGGGSTGMGFTTGALIAAGGGGAGLGGAIFNDDGIITIENSTFSGNSAIGGKGGTGNSGTPNGEDGSGAGGAIFAYGGSPGGTGTISILNSTLTESTADFGRQVYAYRPSASSPPALHFNNSIFAQSDMSIPDVEGTPSDAGGGFNNLVGSTNLVVDVLLNSVVALPNLGSLADNGGGILTHLPLFGSPAIDAGNNDNALTLTTDQRLYAPRIFGSAVDIGSVETSALPASPPLELTPPPEQTGTEGISGTYQLGSLSDAANTGNYSVTVQWGDGTSDTQFTQPTMGTLAAQGHTYASDGTYVVSVFAENSLQTSNTIQFNIVVANTPPMLTAPPDQNGTEGIAGTFNLGSLDDLYTSGDYTITVNWGDGSSDNIFTQSAVGVFPPLDHTYATDGSYIVSVSAVESDINQDNISNTIQFNIVVVNSPPRLVAPADQLSSEGSNTSFSLGTLSDPNNSGNYTIAVNWGDGRPNTVFTQATTGQLTTQSHTYIQNGTYDVTVTATDGDGTSNAITFTVLTANVLPAITPAATQSGLTHNPIDLNIGSFADPGILDSPWTVSIDFGDGSVPVVFDQPSPGAIPIQTHAFSSAGTYPVTVSVTDDGGTSQSTFNVIVSDKLGETFATGGPTTGESRTSNGTVRYDVVPFGPLYSDTVRVAEGDVTGDGVPDLITGTGPGSINCFFVFDGVTHEVLHGKVPFEESFTGGIFVAVGDLNGDDRDEIIATADFGGGTRLRVFDGITTDPIADFFGIDDSNFRGGAHAAVGDFNNDGIGDLIVTAGAGGGPRVAIYDGSSVMQNNPVKLVSDFFAFDPSFRGGTFVAAGDVNGDGFADAIFGAGIGGSPRVSVVNGMSLLSSGTQSLLANFFVGDSRDRNGVRVAAKQLDGDHRADIVTGSGNGSGSRVLAYLGSELVANGNSIPKTFLDFDAFNGVNSGVFVG